MNPFKEFDFELIRIVSINDSFTKYYDFKNGYWFFKEHNANDNFSCFVHLTYQMAKKCTDIISSVMKSWESFIEDPGEAIESNFDTFKEWLESVLFESYETREELHNSKPISRMIGNIDNEISTPEAEETRKYYKKAKYHHLPIELKQKLLAADKELQEYINQIVSEKDQDGNPITKNIKGLFSSAIKKKNDYNYLKLLDQHDVERIIFAKDRNTIRDNRRIILSELYKKLSGKEPKSMSEVTKKLGIESGKEFYLFKMDKTKQ